MVRFDPTSIEHRERELDTDFTKWFSSALLPSTPIYVAVASWQEVENSLLPHPDGRTKSKFRLTDQFQPAISQQQHKVSKSNKSMN